MFDNISLTSILRNFGILCALGGVTWYLFNKKSGGGSSSSYSSKGGGIAPGAVNLTAKALEGHMDAVVGRDEEIMRATQVLSRRTKNNVLLIGPPGVGKTAIVEGLAQRLAAGDVPLVMKGKEVWSLTVADLMSGTKYRGEFEERVARLLKEIAAAGRKVILFVDEVHTIMQAKGTEGAVNFSDILKPALARGDLQLIGATTSQEYEQFIKPDESWDRRFQPVLVDEPSIDEAIGILQGIKDKYETFHHVHFTDGAISAAVRLSQEYVKGRRLPDKAIDLIDEAAAMVNVQGEHHHSVALLHGAARNVAEETKPEAEPVVDVEHIKRVVGEWLSIDPKDIH